MDYREDSSLKGRSPRHRVALKRVSSTWGLLEIKLGGWVPFSPSTWSWLKFLLFGPLIIGILINAHDDAFTQAPLLFGWLGLKKSLITLIGLSLLCDSFRRWKLSRLLSEAQDDLKDEAQRQWIDRVSDLPLSLFATYWLLTGPLNEQVLLSTLVLLRAIFEVATTAFLLLGRGPEKTRLRTVISDLNLYVLLSLIANLHPKLITPESAVTLLGLQVAFSGLVFAYQLRLLQKRFIADTLSGLNFCCGLVSLYYSSQHAFDVSLLYLLLGGAFDGFDGAAARRFGGTRFGVYSDDIADGMNYGIAPAYAVYQLMGGIEGQIIGSFYAIFTLSRLVYFTLNKDEGDPSYFAGVPSPVGGMMVMSSVVLFIDKPLWVSFLVGVSATLMVSFKTPYVHIFRAFSARSSKTKRQALIGAPLFLIVFLAITLFWGTRGAASVILTGACLYGFIPSIVSFYLAIFPPAPSED